MKALLILGMQNDFMPGGALSVPDAESLIPLINALIPKFSLVIAVQDWHPADHVSFASNHLGKHPGEIVMVKGHEQALWPPHCVQDTHGAALVDGLHKDKIERVFYKGTDAEVGSYSAFFDNARENGTGLGDYLLERQVKELTIVGVGTEYSVLYSAWDATDLGFSVIVIKSACRGINLKPRDVENAYLAMKAKGASVI
ncbi:MAG TPA: bifunctional nicotinamidase/pyrazinamidase [Rhabdochlamydiaceae bacterium]